MQLSIITLNFRKPQLTLNCIDSLYQIYGNEFRDNQFELIVVDNFSQDDSVNQIEKEIKKKKYANCQLVESKLNRGFGAGNNLGVTKANGKVIVFLNNDTLVRKGLKEMLNFLENHENVKILGGQLKNTDGTLQSSSGRFYNLWNLSLFLFGLQRFGLIDRSPSQIKQVDWVKGALMMVRKDVFISLGGFDEHIFMYLEDMEFCFRAKEKGYKVLFYPDVDIIHQDQGSSSRTFAIVNIYKNILYFYGKHKSSIEYNFAKSLLLSKAYFVILMGMLLQKRELVSRYKKAIKF